MQINIFTGMPYLGRIRGILTATAEENNYPPEWATYLQWRNHGFKVKKGEKGIEYENKFITSVLFNSNQVIK